MGNSKRIAKIGDVCIGGDYPIAIQSMCNTKTHDVDAVVAQILALEDVGCEIIRVSVTSDEEALAISKIRPKIHIPLVCDIQYDYRHALMSIENGADKIRINPGYIESKEKVKEVANKAQKYNIPIRIGVNSGSLRKEQLEKYGKVTAKGLCESAIYEASLLEEFGFENIVISIKSSDVLMCDKAYRLFKEQRDYPLHLGITEAGTLLSGSVKSAVGLTMMLKDGIGDTIRVSLTADPINEVVVAKQILAALGDRKPKVEIVSCPTCGRTQIDLISLANEVEAYANTLDKELKIAVMGCPVNGPGEAREADIGVAGGHGEGLIFAHGQIIKKVAEDKLLEALKEEIAKL